MKKNNLLVSIFCPTYNHSKYIEQCLNGIVMQKTNFQFEVIVQDDASTDDSQKIIKEFAEKYNFIVPVLHTENIYSKGGDLNEYFVKNAKGKYIAFCEGDDYWTDPYKLQKQVDFLEANPDYSICFHKVKLLENDKLIDDYITKVPSETTAINDLAKGNYIHTPSVIFRNNLFKVYPESFYQSPVGDYFLHMLNAQYGKIRCINDCMAVYRVHHDSYWIGKGEIDTHFLWLKVLDLLIDYFQYKDVAVAEILKNQKAKTLNKLSYWCSDLYNEKEFDKLKYYTENIEKSDPFFLFETIIIQKEKIKELEKYNIRRLLRRLRAKVKKHFKPI